MGTQGVGREPIYQHVYILTARTPNLIKVEILSQHTHSSFSVNRSFCQICQNCIREKNSAKKLPLTGVEPLTLGLTVLLISCLSCLIPVLDPIA